MVSKKAAVLWGIAALIAGGAIGYAGYGSMNNQVVVSGAGMAITKSDMTNKLTQSSSNALFSVAKSEAMQQLYPQKVLTDDDAAKKAANKFINTYVENNGGRKTLDASLKAQHMTYAKWRDAMLPQAVAQVKSEAQLKQSLEVVKDAKVVKASDIDNGVKNYRMYVTNAYMTKDQTSADKLADEIRNTKDVDKIDANMYQQRQDGLKVSSIDGNSDSASVIDKLKDAKAGDVVTVPAASGTGVYVFQVKRVNTYDDYKKNGDSEGIKSIKKAVATSLNQQIALSTDKLGAAQAKVFKSKNIHFAKSTLDKQFYRSLVSQTNMGNVVSSQNAQ